MRTIRKRNMQKTNNTAKKKTVQVKKKVNTKKNKNRMLASRTNKIRAYSFFTTNTMGKIREGVGSVGGNESNEYMVCYWGVNFTLKHKNTGSQMVFHLPVLIYNTFKQKVSTGYIEYNLDKKKEDVENQSEKYKERALTHLIDNIKPAIMQIFGKEGLVPEATLTPMNTIHRHPTGVDSFSSTDLAIGKKPGICHMFSRVSEDMVTFSSIMQHKPDATMVNTECRLVMQKDENTIEYKLGKTRGVEIDTIQPDPLFEALFIQEKTSNKVKQYTDQIQETQRAVLVTIANEIVNKMSELEPIVEVHADYIEPIRDNRNMQKNIYSSLWDYADEDDGYEEVKTVFKQDKKKSIWGGQLYDYDDDYDDGHDDVIDTPSFDDIEKYYYWQ